MWSRCKIGEGPSVLQYLDSDPEVRDASGFEILAVRPLWDARDLQAIAAHPRVRSIVIMVEPNANGQPFVEQALLTKCDVRVHSGLDKAPHMTTCTSRSYRFGYAKIHYPKSGYEYTTDICKHDEEEVEEVWHWTDSDDYDTFSYMMFNQFQNIMYSVSMSEWLHPDLAVDYGHSEGVNLMAYIIRVHQKLRHGRDLRAHSNSSNPDFFVLVLEFDGDVVMKICACQEPYSEHCLSVSRNSSSYDCDNHESIQDLIRWCDKHGS